MSMPISDTALAAKEARAASLRAQVANERAALALPVVDAKDAAAAILDREAAQLEAELAGLDRHRKRKPPGKATK
jgi:hypothetical protein